MPPQQGPQLLDVGRYRALLVKAARDSDSADVIRLDTESGNLSWCKVTTGYTNCQH